MRALLPRSPHLPVAFRNGSLPLPRSAGEDNQRERLLLRNAGEERAPLKESPQLPRRDRQHALERGHIRELSALRRIAHHHGAAAAYDAAVQHQVVDEA